MWVSDSLSRLKAAAVLLVLAGCVAPDGRYLMPDGRAIFTPAPTLPAPPQFEIPAPPGTVDKVGWCTAHWQECHRPPPDPEKDRRDAEAAKLAQQASQERAQKAARDLQVHVDADAKRGYHPITIEDFELDRKQMKVGTKVAVTGFYRREGDLEKLNSDYRGTYAEPAYSLVLLTEDAPRETRKRLLEAGGGVVCRDGLCQLRILGHVVPCVLTERGRKVKDTVCLALDELW